MEPTDQQMKDACHFWQVGRDGGSTLLRAAARVLLGQPHYFGADFIEAEEAKARADQLAREHAAALLLAIGAQAPRTATSIATDAKWVGAPVVERGLKPKGNAIDDQIRARIGRPGAVLTMPLWGFSLSREVAHEYGTHFILKLEGPLTAVPAWTWSGEKAKEAELIAGGVYRVTEVAGPAESTTITLRQIGVLGSHAAFRDQLLGS